MKNLILANALIACLVSGSIQATERVPVALAEGFDYGTQPQVPTTRGPITFVTRVNDMLSRSALVTPQNLEAPMNAIPLLRLNLLAIETGKANEITYSFVVQQWAPTGKIVGATDLQLRTCDLAAMDPCAAIVVRAVESAAANISH